MRIGRGRAPGKLILVGEHAVVYGHPALAIPVNLFTDVVFQPYLSSHTSDERLARALSALSPMGHFEIQSALPIGAGMGSSASLAVAAVRAIDDGRGLTQPAEAVAEAAMAAERVFHGNPSGLDVAVIAHARPVWFVRGQAPEALHAPPWTPVILNSQTPGRTREQVEAVAGRRGAVEGELRALGELAVQARDLLDNIELLGAVLSQAHRHLQAIGVSTAALDHLVARALRWGATGAKLTGAGGGGVVIALHPDPAWLVAQLQREGIRTLLAPPIQETS